MPTLRIYTNGKYIADTENVVSGSYYKVIWLVLDAFASFFYSADAFECSSRP